jgi:hypothetical protein
MHKIINIDVKDEYRIDLDFDDGTKGTVDLSDLAGQGVFVAWDDYSKFRDVRIGDTGDLRWGGDIDLCPDSLYMKVTGKKAEDIFPDLKREPTHA